MCSTWSLLAEWPHWVGTGIVYALWSFLKVFAFWFLLCFFFFFPKRWLKTERKSPFCRPLLFFPLILLLWDHVWQYLLENCSCPIMCSKYSFARGIHSLYKSNKHTKTDKKWLVMPSEFLCSAKMIWVHCMQMSGIFIKSSIVQGPTTP